MIKKLKKTWIAFQAKREAALKAKEYFRDEILLAKRKYSKAKKAQELQLSRNKTAEQKAQKIALIFNTDFETEFELIRHAKDKIKGKQLYQRSREERVELGSEWNSLANREHSLKKQLQTKKRWKAAGWDKTLANKALAEAQAKTLEDDDLLTAKTEAAYWKLARLQEKKRAFAKELFEAWQELCA